MLYNHELMSLINTVLFFFSRAESIFGQYFGTQNKLDSFFNILPGLQVYVVATSNIFSEI